MDLKQSRQQKKENGGKEGEKGVSSGFGRVGGGERGFFLSCACLCSAAVSAALFFLRCVGKLASPLGYRSRAPGVDKRFQIQSRLSGGGGNGGHLQQQDQG